MRSAACGSRALAAPANAAPGLTAFQLPPTHGRRELGAAAAMVVGGSEAVESVSALL